MKRFCTVLGMALLFALASVLAHAQLRGQVRGNVVDTEGKPIVDARIELESLESGIVMKTKTNKKGNFLQLLTVSGAFKLTVTKEGYFDFSNSEVFLRGEDVYTLPTVTLTPARSSTGAVLDEAAKEKRLAEAKMAKEVEKDFNNAIELTKLGQFDEAIALYQGILEKAPLLPEVHFNLGVVHMRKEDWANAESCFQKVIELNPDLREVYLALGETFLASGQMEKAVPFLTGATEKFPDNPTLHFSLGLACFNTNRTSEALQAFNRTKELDPERAESYFFIGSLLISENKIAEAVENLEKYLAMNPTNERNVQTAQQLLPELKKSLK
ncbi:MAG: tetratricopeptide repeat protein [Vicinamibacteria bacterium]|nr:tetratricopeptide repeat protein [Vicinamibacteria bacterium]